MSTPAVVIDTNVFVASGFNADSHSRQILDAVRAGDLILVWNEATRDETIAVVDQIPPLSLGDADEYFEEDGRFDGANRPDQFQLGRHQQPQATPMQKDTELVQISRSDGGDSTRDGRRRPSHHRWHRDRTTRGRGSFSSTSARLLNPPPR